MKSFAIMAGGGAARSVNLAGPRDLAGISAGGLVLWAHDYRV
jgi:hypothetical protein